MLIWRHFVAIGLTIMFCTFPVVMVTIENPKMFRWTLWSMSLGLTCMAIGFVGTIWT